MSMLSDCGDFINKTEVLISSYKTTPIHNFDMIQQQHYNYVIMKRH